MDLSICILTHSQPVLLPRCVAACLDEIRQAQLCAEIIIIDNASADRYPEEVASSFPSTRVIRNQENVGFAEANNRAIKSSCGRTVLILNDDAVLLPDSLRLMMAKLDSDESIAAVGPKLLNSDGSLQRHFTNRRFPHIRGIICSIFAFEERLAKRAFTRTLFTLDRDPEQSGETDQAAGACLLIRRDALERVGLFDDTYYYWFEDTDLCYRLKKAGWKIMYLAEAQVVHHGSASMKRIDEWQRTGMFLKSLLLFYKKNKGRVRGLLLKLSLASMLLYRAFRVALHNLIKGRRRDDGSTESVRAYLGLVRLVFGGTA
jgi:N-acetylglucosaminyl-diphospho-decaprenol L-rhamnosyltransferase